MSTAFLVVQGMLAQRPTIVAYIGSTAPLQEFQHVSGRASTSVVVPWLDIGNLIFF